ncbi:MAG: hypothetical protein LBM98_00840 [Oscillospiraceae bacterium]|nr:hypothetical protein [Oscillospiraceae bacterium]
MDVGCALRGRPPRRLRAAPLPRGEWVWTWVADWTWVAGGNSPLGWGGASRRGGLPAPCADVTIVLPTYQRSAHPRTARGRGLPLPVIASRGKLAIRTIETGAAIQCRSPQIRMLRSRHWIAARLDALRIASAVALAKTAHGAGT